MRRTLLPFALLLAAGAASAAVVERIAIRVNDRILTSSELRDRENEASRDALRSDPGIDLRTRATEIRKRVVDEALRELLLLERAREIDLKADDAEVDSAIGRMKLQNQIRTEEQFVAALRESGMTLEQMKDQVRRNLLIQHLVSREIQAKLDVTDEFLRSLYNTEKESYRKPDQVRLSEILVLASTPDARDEARRKVEAAAKRIAAGEEFAKVAREVSQGSTREKGGDLGLIAKGELAEEIDKVVFALAPKELSKPVESKFGIHLLRVEEKLPVVYTPFEEAKEKIRAAWQDKEYEKRLKDYIEGLRQKYFVKVDVADTGSL
jgi:parvulin-like peptidyl-prolyl isomerase